MPHVFLARHHFPGLVTAPEIQPASPLQCSQAVIMLLLLLLQHPQQGPGKCAPLCSHLPGSALQLQSSGAHATTLESGTRRAGLPCQSGRGK